MEIDLVYMWVDGADPVWRAKKARYAGEQVAEQQRADVAGDCRFVENDELRYSLRSAERFAPWIRRIYVVTDGQTPAWLDTSHPRVRIVDHREILPADALPIFNSSAIEWALPRIPGLADRFLLANDDTFFGAPVGRSSSSRATVIPYLRLKHKRVTADRRSIYGYKIYESQRRIRELFGKSYTLAPHHNIDAYCRDEFLACAEQFRDETEATMQFAFPELRKPPSLRGGLFRIGAGACPSAPCDPLRQLLESAAAAAGPARRPATGRLRAFFLRRIPIFRGSTASSDLRSSASTTMNGSRRRTACACVVFWRSCFPKSRPSRSNGRDRYLGPAVGSHNCLLYCALVIAGGVWGGRTI